MMSVLVSLQEQLPHEYQAFHNTLNVMDDEEIVVLKTAGRLDIMRVKGAGAANFEPSNNDDIIAHLQQWQTRCDFEVSGAGHDWVNVRFRTLPEGIDAFTEEVYHFCPGITGQYFGCCGEMTQAFEDEDREMPASIRERLDGID
ncbi:MAG: hypothetical protein JWN98_2621 [Abditibacteriota bacterium]|nr:hypothetical protein [Abditibacteriota bacterium]